MTEKNLVIKIKRRVIILGFFQWSVKKLRVFSVGNLYFFLSGHRTKSILDFFSNRRFIFAREIQSDKTAGRSVVRWIALLSENDFRTFDLRFCSIWRDIFKTTSQTSTSAVPDNYLLEIFNALLASFKEVII